jgi:hypothetical protein
MNETGKHPETFPLVFLKNPQSGSHYQHLEAKQSFFR